MKKPKISAPQMQALEDVRDHGDPWRRVRGQSQHGGWSSVMRVIEYKRGWVKRKPGEYRRATPTSFASSTSDYVLTPAGVDALGRSGQPSANYRTDYDRVRKPVA